MPLTLTSSAFAHNGEIPTVHTCEGRDVSPPLAWTGLPAGTKSIALIVDDPDAPDPKAPKMTWVHWVVYDLPAGTASVPEAASGGGGGGPAGAGLVGMPAGSREGTNDWKKTGWGGPCPPTGRHRYFH